MIVQGHSRAWSGSVLFGVALVSRCAPGRAAVDLALHALGRLPALLGRPGSMKRAGSGQGSRWSATASARSNMREA